MRSQSLFIATAVLESTTGVALVAVPNAVVPLLLGAAFDAPDALVVARIAGAHGRQGQAQVSHVAEAIQYRRVLK